MGRSKGNRVYAIKNIETGEIFEGKGEEVSVIMGCTNSTLYKYEREGRIFKGIWEVKCFDAGEGIEELTEEDLQKWDNFIMAWNKKYRRIPLRKPQGIV